MRQQQVKYPIGQQSFENLRKENCLYVDKTAYIYQMLESGSRFYFLGRPRRFGKSLLLSTIQCVFEGKKDLFNGLFISNTDWQWDKYPVLRIDLNVERYAQPGLLDDVLDKLFSNWEAQYGVENISTNLSLRFHSIIEAAYQSTGRQVVILVDEYDKPLVANMNDNANFDHYRQRLASIYSHFKSSADHIRFVFLTGVSRFSKLNIFSDLNNINDISFDNAYADICGITEAELKTKFQQGIEALSGEYRCDNTEIYAELKENYDGYRFAQKGSEIYNPWSVLNAMAKKQIANYWNETGLPTLIAESLGHIDSNLSDLLDTDCSLDELRGLDLQSPMPIPLLYQTGYLTIKSYNRQLDDYHIGLPNKEVRQGLFDMLLPFYAHIPQRTTAFYINEFTRLLLTGEAKEFMRHLQTFFAAIPYEMDIANERNFHNALYVFFTLLGLKTRTEVHTSNGSIDLLIETDKYIYIIELKYDASAQVALNQIKTKEYHRPYTSDRRKTILIGASFSSSTRRIDQWEIE